MPGHPDPALRLRTALGARTPHRPADAVDDPADLVDDRADPADTVADRADGADGPPWAAPPAGWVPPGSFGAQLRALLADRLPAPLRGAQWNPGRRGLLAVSVLALVGVAFAGVLLLRGRPHAVAVESPASPTSVPSMPSMPSLSPLATATAPVEVLVDVEGKVARPGVVRLPRGSRVQDALAAAGGALAGADISALNRAQVLIDGEQLRVGLPGVPIVNPAGGTGEPGGTNPANSAPVDLNTASVAQLDALPGVGPVTAQHIVDWRTQHGRFTAVEQLQEVSGIGPATYAALAPLVTV